MEDNIYDLIVETFKKGMHIPLIRRGKYYTFIEISTTVVNNITYDNAIHYRISKVNTKKITKLFIELTYEYYFKSADNSFPSRKWYESHEILKYEYKSRPCNYSVVQGLIYTAIKNK